MQLHCNIFISRILEIPVAAPIAPLPVVLAETLGRQIRRSPRHCPPAALSGLRAWFARGRLEDFT